MKKIVIINGLIATAIIVGISYALLWQAGNDAAHANQEWLGYLVMVVGLAFIFIAIKQHRDKNLGGVIDLLGGVKIGVSVTLIAAFFYVLAWEIYYSNAGKGFIETYQQSHLEQLKESGASDEKITATTTEMIEFAALYDQFHFRALITLLEILPVGFIITLISAFLLRTQRSRNSSR